MTKLSKTNIAILKFILFKLPLINKYYDNLKENKSVVNID